VAVIALLLIGGLIIWSMTRTPRGTDTANTSTSQTPSSNQTANAKATPTATEPAPLSGDEKHRLFQAAGITKDDDLIIPVAEKLGLSDAKGNPTPALQPFVDEHLRVWAPKNAAWVQEYRDVAKAREYVRTHMP
jgi:hypothetical protein